MVNMKLEVDATLKEIRSICSDFFGSGIEEWEQERLIYLVSALDEWITKGGDLPKEWDSF